MEGLINYILKSIDWLLNLILGDIYKGFKNRIKLSIQRVFKSRTKSFKTNHKDEGTKSVGGRETNFVICGGSGEYAYDRDTIQIFYNNSVMELPSELKAIRDDIVQREEAKKAQGEKWMYNTYQVAFTKAFQTNMDFIEKPYPVFHFQKSDYFNFQATVGSLDKPLLKDGETIREKYIDKEIDEIHYPSPVLSQGVGVVLTVVTSDEKIVLTRRRKDVGIRQGELDVSVVEAIDPDKDIVESSKDSEGEHRKIDLYRAAIRGVEEELGLAVQPDQVHLLGYGVDLEYYQWNIIGTVETELTSKQILEKKSSGTHGLNEISYIEFVQYDFIKVAELIRDEPMWSTGQIALYWTMVYQSGNPLKSFAEKVFGKVLGKKT